LPRPLLGERIATVVTLWLSASLRSRASVLAPTAERFLHEWLGDEARHFRGGAQGLVALCQHMERWVFREDVGEESERRFVEGAGALLGLLLIDHLGDAQHAERGSVHRLRLGRHGFFDPFAAVDGALEAEDVRAELSRQVAVAEAEAKTRGPVSRVVASLLGLVERERPELIFDEQFESSLWLRCTSSGERIEIDLRRAIESTRDQDEHAVREVARRLLAMLPGAAEPRAELDEVRGRIVPRLARTDTLRELATHADNALFSAPLADELRIALLVEHDGRARYVQQRELARWSIAEATLLELARENLAARSARARLGAIDTAHGPLLIARTGDGRDSARVLLKSLYGALSARLGERVFVGLPHRDTFFACGEGNPALFAELARRTAVDAARAPHRLSERVFELTADGLHPLHTAN
jgi:uncharacterized protein YtpQ (UPF0354 family)